jgi:amino acid transporter
LGCSIAAGYILNALFAIPAADSQLVLDWVVANGAQFTETSQAVVDYLAANAGTTAPDAIAAVSTSAAIEALTPAIRTWEALQIAIPGLGTLHFNATFVIGLILMLIMFAIQHRGIASTAKAQKILAIIVLVPLLLVGLVPLFSGSINYMNVASIVPPSAAYAGDVGAWTVGGWTLFLGGLYIAAWSTYGF